MFKSIEELSQESSPSCKKNLMQDFEGSSRNKAKKHRLDDFMKELERNLECIDNGDIGGLESQREMRQAKDVRRTAAKQSRVQTAEDDYLIKDEETRIFMQAVYPSYQSSESSIPLKEFLSNSLLYFFPETSVSGQVLSILRKLTQPILTTTSPQSLSLNALSVVTKTTPLRLVLLQQLLTSQHRFATKKLHSEHQQILQEFVKLEKEVKDEREGNQRKSKELKDREKQVREKEKQVSAREKEMKEKLQKQYQKRVDMFTKVIQQSMAQIDKRAAAIERNIKYKIHILDNRLQQVSKIKEHKLTVDIKYKEKVIRLEKENQQLRSRCKQIDQITTDYLKEKENLVKKIVNFEQKIAKLEKKKGNLKQELTGKDELLKVISAKIQEIKKQNEILKQEMGKSQVKKQVQENQIVDKTPRNHEFKLNSKSFVRLLNTMIESSEDSIPKIIKFYRQEPNRPLDFELVEIYFQKQKQLSQLFISFFFEIFNVEKASDKMYLINQSLPITDFLIKMELFSFNFNYSKERHDNILNNALKTTNHRIFSNFSNSQLSQKCLKFAKKQHKTPIKQDLPILLTILSILLSVSHQNLNQSLTNLHLLLNSQNNLGTFLRYDLLPYLLLKCSSIPLLCPILIDLILSCCSNQHLTRTLSQLEQSETYLLLLRILLLPLQVSEIEKLSIILQRYSYKYGKEMVIQSEVLKVIRGLVSQYESSKDRLVAANFKSILNSST